jgi:hypothetical protein
MLLWHAGIAAAIVYVTLGRARIDYRFILLGAIAPDLVDGMLSLAWFPGWQGRGVAHTIAAVVVVALVVILGLRGTRRLAWFGLPVGWLLHLVGDGMWEHPETFLWPLFGSDLSEGGREPYSWELFVDPLGHLATWAGELIGVAILAWFVVAFGLRDGARRSMFLRDGRLRA